MIRLIISGKQAVIKTGTSFKLTRMNPYFEDSGDYTFEVELPLLGCYANQEIFGALHRAETSLAALIGKKYKMQLLAPPLNVVGYAQVTTVTDETVKVQLVAGRSALTHAIDDDTSYVDELSLGNCWDSLPSQTYSQLTSQGYETFTFNPGEDIVSMAAFFCAPYAEIDYYDDEEHDYHYIAPLHGSTAERDTYMFGTQGKTDSVCFPIYSTDSEAIANELVYNQTGTGSATNIALKVDGIERTHRDPVDPDNMPDISDGYEYYYDQIVFAPQPYLLDVIKRIVKAAGFSVGDWSYYEQSNTATGILIANARQTLERAKMLPHWTISEFLKEVQNLLCCVFFVRDGNSVDMIPRVTWMQDLSTRAELSNVIDELSTDIADEEDSSKDISTGNIEYAWVTSDDILRLPDEVWENAEIKEYDSYTAIKKAFDALSTEEKSQSRYLYKDKSKGRVYASLSIPGTPTTYSLERVDYYPPLLHDTSTREISHQLKLVPARIRPLSDCVESYDVGKVDYSVLETDDKMLKDTAYYNIDAAINSNSDESNEDATDERDVLLLAWNIHTVYKTASISTTDVLSIPVAMGINHYKDEDTNFYVNPGTTWLTAGVPEDGVFSFEATKKATSIDAPTPIGDFHTSSIRVDTRCQHLFQFTDDINLDPTVPYLIHGKVYACYKLELTIDENGIQPLKKGYFCEIKQ